MGLELHCDKCGVETEWRTISSIYLPKEMRTIWLCLTCEDAFRRFLKRPFDEGK